MKKLTYIIVGACLTFITSCVDLDQYPKSFITEEEYLENMNLEGLGMAATGLYNTLWHGNYGFSCRMMRIDCSADQLASSPKAGNVLDYIITLTPSISANTADWDTTWENFWKVINGSNKLITGTVVPENEDEAKAYKAVLGEAYFMRALAYYYLVRLYGDIPCIKTPTEALEPQERAPVSDIYNQIIVPDLLEAAAVLPEKSRSGTSSTPSKWAAKAMLADVYMTMAGWPLKLGQEYYAKAAAESLEIIEKSGLTLTPAYGDLWKEAKKEDSNEHMFAVHNSVAQKKASQFGKSFYPRDYERAGWADYYGNIDYFNSYPEGERKDFNYMTEWPTKVKDEVVIVQWQNSQDKYPCISKYMNYDQGLPASNAISNGITPILRYAQVLLTYAEASNLATGSVNSKALECLNEVQRRAKSTLTTTTNSDEFDKAVFAERGYEFLAEYKRWFDLVRREKVSEFKAKQYPTSLFKANNHYYFPIPSEQILLTGWTNNSGY